MVTTDTLEARLREIAEHDWRVSFLAHTSDTAKEAADRIAALEAEVAALKAGLEWMADQDARIAEMATGDRLSPYTMLQQYANRARILVSGQEGEG